MKKYSRYAEKYRTTAKDGIPGTSKSISALDKLTTRNANRAGKKAERQLAKINLNKSIIHEMSKRTLILEMQDTVIIGKHGDFGKAISPLEDKVTEIKLGIDSCIDSEEDEIIFVDLDGDFSTKNIDELPEGVTREQVEHFLESNMDNIKKWVNNRISSLIDKETESWS